MVVFIRRPRNLPCLKGLNYDVRLPRGGRKDPGPVLSEDVYLDRLKKRPRLGHGKTKEDVIGSTASFDAGYNPLLTASSKQLFVPSLFSLLLHSSLLTFPFLIVFLPPLQYCQNWPRTKQFQSSEARQAKKEEAW